MTKTIAMVAPAGAIDGMYIDGAAERLQTWGYAVQVMPHARGRYGRFAANDEERAEDLNNALGDPAIDIILCTRGGYGMQRIIDRIAPIGCTLPTTQSVSPENKMPNEGKAAENGSLPSMESTISGHRKEVTEKGFTPITKPIVGFSDITCLHQLAALSGQASLHGLMCKHIATLPDDAEALQLFRRALAGEALDYTLPAHPLNRAGEAQGCIIGGNLSVLYGLQGTPYSLNSVLDKAEARGERCILFIEDIAERHYHIDRMIQNLRLSGVFERIAGLVVGQFSDCEDDPSMGCTLQETIAQAVATYDFPVLFDFPAGHVERNLPLWFGVGSGLTVSQKGEGELRITNYE